MCLSFPLKNHQTYFYFVCFIWTIVSVLRFNKVWLKGLQEHTGTGYSTKGTLELFQFPANCCSFFTRLKFLLHLFVFTLGSIRG